MKTSLKLLIHGIYWLVFLMFNLKFGKSQSNEVWPSLSDFTTDVALQLIWAILIFYLFYFYIFRFFEEHRFYIYLGLSVLSSILLSFLFLLVYKGLVAGFEISGYKKIIPVIIGSFIIAQCGCLIRGFENWFTQVRQKAELENRNLRNELELLKSQVNPHFLFNTLNNIDSLIYSEPKNASNSLITLSDMLRYMIYDTSPEKVPVDKEITYLKNYIKLQSLRFKNPDYVRFSVSGEFSQTTIAPLIMLVFVENAFKYAVNSGSIPVIDISLHCTNKQIVFYCTNYFASTSKQSGGIGLENVKRRLGLLYKNNHNLLISKENDTFTVHLTLNV